MQLVRHLCSFLLAACRSATGKDESLPKLCCHHGILCGRSLWQGCGSGLFPCIHQRMTPSDAANHGSRLHAFYSLLCSCQTSLHVKHSLVHIHATTTSDRDMQITLLFHTNRPQASCHVPVLHCCLTSRPNSALCLQVSAIVAVGVTEGVAHVNWNKYLKILAWWYLGCVPLFAITALFNWQGDWPSTPNASALASVMHLRCAASCQLPSPLAYDQHHQLHLQLGR